MMWYDVFCFLYFDLSLRWKTMCWGQFANVLTMYSCVALCAADLWMVEYVQAQIFMKSSLSLGPYDFWDTRKAHLGTQTGEKGWAAKSCKETLSKEIDGGGPQTNLFGRVDLMHRTAHTRPSLSIQPKHQLAHPNLWQPQFIAHSAANESKLETFLWPYPWSATAKKWWDTTKWLRICAILLLGLRVLIPPVPFHPFLPLQVHNRSNETFVHLQLS
jgi:hypothetical protein